LLVEGARRENGGIRLVHDIARRWHRAGVPVRLLVLETGPGPLLPLDPLLSVAYGSNKVRRFRAALPRIVPRLIRECRRADVVIAGSEVGYALLLGWVAARVTRRPLAVVVHSPLREAVSAWDPARLRPALLWVHRRVDAAFCVSEALVESVTANGLPPERAFAFAAGIDVADVIELGREPLSPELVKPDEPLVVAVGRLAPEKGLDILLQAHATVRAAGVPHQLLLVGEGPERQRLAELADGLGVAGSTRFAGHLANPQPFIAAADLFVLPSRYEGLGLVLLEALAHATPVVAADCPFGPRLVLRDGQLGDLVPVEDPAALASAMAQHLRSPERLRRLAQEGASWTQRFDASRGAEQLLDAVVKLHRHPSA
jgi:glycosyltransferase involved in cell wall biosynthesis